MGKIADFEKNHENPSKFNNGKKKCVTADNPLCNLVKNAVKKNAVDFDAIKLNAIHPKGYTLYCAAKDIYLGTRHLAVSDLIDMNLVTPKLFGLITNAMAIRRFGMRAFAVSEHMWQ